MSRRRVTCVSRKHECRFEDVQMTTTTAIPLQRVAQRSTLQKTFVDATVLSGFTDPSHFDMLCGEYLGTLSEVEAAAVRASADAARSYVASLPGIDPAALNDVIRGQVEGPHVEEIQAEPVFQQVFGSLPHQFAHVDLSRLIALQAWVEPRRDVVPSDEQGLNDFCLPRRWEVPAEISYIPQTNTIQVLSSDPALSQLKLDFDQRAGKITMSPPQHPNLVQVAIFMGRAYLRNGYHRVVDALAQGHTTLPALVVQMQSHEQVALPAAGCFNIFHAMGAPRPPLVADFLGQAATTTKVRERRYGLLIGLDVNPFSVGV